MRITVKLFAFLRDQAGASELTLDLGQGARVADAAEQLKSHLKSPDALRSVAFAVNRQYAPATALLHDGDELAIIPPVSGGAW